MTNVRWDKFGRYTGGASALIGLCPTISPDLVNCAIGTQLNARIVWLSGLVLDSTT